jgi:phosphoglycolate phosphatase-like HAD superfamily hydrolase
VRNEQPSLPTVVFDLDGTLVDSDDFDGELYIAAVRQVIGDVEINGSWRRYRHVTDAGVLAQIIEELALPDGNRIKSQVRALFGSLVQRHLDGGGACLAIAGAKNALERLRASGYKVGVATGGWGHTARMKLDHAGIPAESVVIASSDDSMDRVEIMTACLRRLGGHPDRAIYVGDGLWDLEASRKAGWAFIGVGERLRGHCENWIADFTDEAWQLPRVSYPCAP